MIQCYIGQRPGYTDEYNSEEYTAWYTMITGMMYANISISSFNFLKFNIFQHFKRDKKHSVYVIMFKNIDFKPVLIFKQKI